MKPAMLVGWLIAGAFLTGCVDYEERITLNPDGSGYVDVHYSGPEDVSVGADSFPPEDEEELLDFLKERFDVEGVSIVEYSLDRRDKRTFVDYGLEFRRLTDLNRTDPLFWEGNFEVERDAAGWKVTRVLRVTVDGWDEPKNAFETWLRDTVADGLLTGVQFRFETVFPEEIRETNADWVRAGRVAVWKYRLSDLLGKKRIVQYVVGR